MDDLGEEESPDKMDEEEVQHDEEDEESARFTIQIRKTKNNGFS